MNYLAHAYLSFYNPEILVGNMIADMIRGKQTECFAEEIRRGIFLHRQIDRFTDEHAVVRKVKKVFNKSAGRYDGIFIDIVYDHFLSIDKLREPTEGWLDFSEWCYKQVDEYRSELPDDFYRMFVRMKDENWLYNYQNNWMIERSFNWITKRAIFLPDDTDVFTDFIENYQVLAESYNQFFPELERFVKNKIHTMK